MKRVNAHPQVITVGDGIGVGVLVGLAVGFAAGLATRDAVRAWQRALRHGRIASALTGEAAGWIAVVVLVAAAAAVFIWA